MLALPIALAATAVLVIQSNAFFGGFVWSWIHGGGASSFVAFVPLAIALAALWGGYAFLMRKRVRRRTLLFAGYALALVAINEAVVPATPLKAWRRQRAMARVDIRNLRDAPLLTAQGHPIGIRLQFEAVFSDTGPYYVSPSSLTPASGEVRYELNFVNFLLSSIEPSAMRDSDGVASVFQQGTVYSITALLFPYFVIYDEATREPCLNLTLPRDLPEEAFLALLSTSKPMKYLGEIHVHSFAPPSQRIVATEFATANAYDVKAIYDALVAEGRTRCK